MATEYYILKPAVDTPETGNAYPAADSYDDYDFNASNSVHKLNFQELPNFEPDIRFKLAKGAKLTDMLSQAAISVHGFLINEKLKEAFEQFNIVPHKYFPATIEDHQGNFHQYFWLHLVWEEGKKLVDYNNSVFFKRKFSNNLGYIELSSEEDFWVKKEEMGSRYMIGIESLKLKGQPPYQLMIAPFKTDIIVDTNVKDLLSVFSGIGFESVSYFQFTWVRRPRF